MKTFICRLNGDDMEAVTDRRSTREMSLCCLIQAESPELIEEPLRDLLRRLHAAPSRALENVRELFLDDIIELSGKPGSAVLWITSTQLGKQPGSLLQLHLPLPIDDTGSMNAYGHGPDPSEHEGEDIEPEPFIVFEQTPQPRRLRKGKQRR